MKNIQERARYGHWSLPNKGYIVDGMPDITRIVADAMVTIDKQCLEDCNVAEVSFLNPSPVGGYDIYTVGLKHRRKPVPYFSVEAYTGDLIW